jgi:hypothetical protein
MTKNKRAVHLSTLQIPSSYESVLAIVPGLHQRPPVLPEPKDPLLALPAPPKQGFDLVLHVVCFGRYCELDFNKSRQTRVPLEEGRYALKNLLTR